ncbi:DUF4190 domain-containing protein [Paenibacillus sp. SEL1]|uniref:DUF4190 domain-containing protein n=1 Tax=Paenibacillus TaxID=44249 RepID=UPI00077C6DBD|nr:MULTISPECIES: DUF4190 domain-containing protein [Paenibacillus]KYG96502.1 hypothetical protein AZE31_22360 [Paenibacillus polymyxa]MCP3778941.1 DUF4190 domain-containing protein [Paenibacillus sp. MZ03-122A]MDY7992340.1 DUF4190 domain-containing protein [Paenibacillus polymyxa]MDY8118782.1 DUF4190 domain-containing protein [Paenibacillus polymyxa]
MSDLYKEPRSSDPFQETNDYNAPFNPPPVVPPTNSKAVASMVLGILSVVIPYLGLIIGIVGIILSSLSLKEINRHGEQGRGMAIAGLVCSIIGTLIYTLIIIFIVIVFIVAASSGDPDVFSDI